MTTLDDLNFIKSKIEQSAQPWAGEFERLKAKISRAGMTLHNPAAQNNVGGGKLIYCGGYNKSKDGVNTVVACNWPVEDGIDAYTLALVGYLSGDEAYSNDALRYLRSWANPANFAGFDPAGSNAKLQAGWTIPWYANTAEILRYTYSEWKDSDRIAVTGLLNRLLPDVIKDSEGAPNNWLHSRIEAHMAAAIFFDDRAMFYKAISRWKEHTRSYIYIASDGAGPVLPKSSQAGSRGAANWSTPKFFPGQTMETCRDLNHQGLGMRSIFNSLAMTVNQGEDILTDTDNRERLIAFLTTQPRWALSKQDHPDGVCNNPIIVTPGNPPDYLRNTAAYAGYPIAYKILSSSSQPLKAAKDHIEKDGPITASKWVTKWETLTHYKP